MDIKVFETSKISTQVNTQKTIEQQTSHSLAQETAFDLSAYLSQRRIQVEAALERSIQVVYPETIYESMRYSLLAGGKRLRPILCLASCEVCGGTQEMAMPTACALEMIHTMSLIHDDLPAIDNDDYRRGKLTNHKVYNEAIAILAGDALLAYAFEFIVENTKNLPAERLLQVVSKLGHAVAATGLMGGQLVDLQSEGLQNAGIETLDFIHTHKTGALLEASVLSGAILAGANQNALQSLSSYAHKIGLAFQIIDDILDITGSQEQLGKTAGKDQKTNKLTYPKIWGLEKSRRYAQELVDEAKAKLAYFGHDAIPLMALAEFITARMN